MRRSYISPEFKKVRLNGTFNMSEESNFFSSVLLSIDDFINIVDESLVWYERENGEQIDLGIESSFDSNVYSSQSSKRNNHFIRLDDSQLENQLNTSTRWILTINLKKLLKEYIFASMKKYRTFEGVRNETTLSNDINIAINEYIEYNIINKYSFERLELFISYNDLRSNDFLRFENIWDPNINKDVIFNKIETETKFDESSIDVIFSQDKISSEFNFSYYYNIFFTKK